MSPVGVLPSFAVFPAAYGLHEESDVVFARIPSLILPSVALAGSCCGAVPA